MDLFFTFLPGIGCHLLGSDPVFCLLVWVGGWAAARNPGLLAAAAGHAFAFVSMWADLWAWVLGRPVSLTGSGHILEAAWPSAPPTFSAGELRQPTTRWLQQMFLSLTLGHLALLSRIQRVMPGTLPNATRNEHSPREYCQVVSASCFLGAKWPPGPCTGLLPQNAVKGTHSPESLPARCSCQGSTFCVLSPFVYTLHLPHCAIVVTGGVHWPEALNFMAVSVAKY